MAEQILQQIRESLRRREAERKHSMENSAREPNVSHDDQMDLRSRLRDLLDKFEDDEKEGSSPVTRDYMDHLMERSMRRMNGIMRRQTEEIARIQEEQSVVTCVMVITVIALFVYIVVQSWKRPIRQLFTSVSNFNRIMNHLDNFDESDSVISVNFQHDALPPSNDQHLSPETAPTEPVDDQTHQEIDLPSLLY